MLTGIALMPIATLMAHSMPLMGCTLKKVPTGVCMMITCAQAGHSTAHSTQCHACLPLTRI
jgi:hypothetical protein